RPHDAARADQQPDNALLRSRRQALASACHPRAARRGRRGGAGEARPSRHDSQDQKLIIFLKTLLRFDAPLVLVAILLIVAVWWWRRPSSRGPRRLLVAFLVVFYLAATPIGANVLVAGLAHGLTRLTAREQARGADAVVVLSAGVGTVK